ncbi:MAG: response regulator [Candidatus Hydrogenedentes bacterium]|nr:response regulator [Candidatus Hydrogenedentota bacterium]
MTTAIRPNILFVDDEPNFLDGLRRMLRPQRDQWEMHFAGGVDEALEILHATMMDAVVSDVNMPVKSGFDLLMEIKAHPEFCTAPVIILTGNAETDLKRRALDLGAADLLNKPVNSEDLIARVRSVLRLKMYEDRLRSYNEELEQRVRERTRELELSRQDIIWRLAKAGEFRDRETGEHVMRVACCSRILAKAAGLPGIEVDRIFLTSPLHDIGKIGIPDGILLKEGKLTPVERNFMERHCEIGASILLEQPRNMAIFLSSMNNQDPGKNAEKASDALRTMSAEIARAHHEHWDGTGYPEGTAGENIPVAARVVAIADVYDALRSPRPYKSAFDVKTTLTLMTDLRGAHFDPRLFDVFREVYAQFENVREQYED